MLALCNFVIVLVENSSSAYKTLGQTACTLCLKKNVPPLTCCSFDIHNLIMIIFGRSVTEKVRNQMMLCFPNSPL